MYGDIMTRKTVFTSMNSFAEAQQKARIAGYEPIGQSRNIRGQYVVFARQRFAFGM